MSKKMNKKNFPGFGRKRQTETLAKRIARENSIGNAVKEHFARDQKIRIRMGYAYIVAMAETEGVNLNPDQIKAVIDTMNDTVVEYNKTKEVDGGEVADTKLYQKVCEALGDENARNRVDFERLFTPHNEEEKNKPKEVVRVLFKYIGDDTRYDVEGLKYDLNADLDPNTGFIIYREPNGASFMMPRAIASEEPDRKFNEETDFIFVTGYDIDEDRWPMNVFLVKHKF